MKTICNHPTFGRNINRCKYPDDPIECPAFQQGPVVGFEPVCYYSQIVHTVCARDERDARIAELEAECERLRGSMMAIEEASANCSCENELDCAAYRFSHVVTRPGCVKNHPEWAEQLDAARAALAAGERK